MAQQFRRGLTCPKRKAAFVLSAKSINSHFPFCPPQLKWSLTALCLQGWLLRYSGDMLPVLWRRFHLCTVQDGEALQRHRMSQRERRREREALTETPTKHGLFLANENLLCLPLHPDARAVGFQITAVNFAQLPHAWLSLISGVFSLSLFHCCSLRLLSICHSVLLSFFLSLLDAVAHLFSAFMSLFSAFPHFLSPFIRVVFVT